MKKLLLLIISMLFCCFVNAQNHVSAVGEGVILGEDRASVERKLAEQYSICGYSKNFRHIELHDMFVLGVRWHKVDYWFDQDGILKIVDFDYYFEDYAELVAEDFYKKRCREDKAYYGFNPQLSEFVREDYIDVAFKFCDVYGRLDRRGGFITNTLLYDKKNRKWCFRSNYSHMQ